MRHLFFPTILSASAAALLVGTLTSTVHAQSETVSPPGKTKLPDSKFGRRSSFIVGVDNVFGFTSEGVSQAGSRDVDDKGFFPGTFGPRLGFDGIWSNGVTFGTGAQLWYAHAKGSDDDVVFIELNPRVGYAAPLGPLGLWARGGPNMITEASKRTDFYFSLRLEGFLVIQPVSHFGLLIGPSFDFGLATARSKGSNEGTWHSTGVLVGLFGEL